MESTMKMDSPSSVKYSPYQYSPLERNQFRLVVLEPGQSSSPIRCRIITHLRNDAPSYEAISYAWGDDTLRTTIQILSSTEKPSALSVPQACVSALRALRSPLDPRTLWIDAVSINQTSLSERSLHARTMSHIYHAASQVVIFLSSTPSEDHTAAVDFVSRGRFKNTPSEMMGPINRLFKHPWFSRIWAIPEVAKARRTAVMYGNTITPWSNFALCARMLSLDVPVMAPIRRLRHKGFIDTISTDQFVKAICEATACDCRDPSDRVFAFLSMYPALMSSSEIASYRSSGFSSMWPGRGQGDSRGKGDVTGRDTELKAATATATAEDESAKGRITSYSHSVETVYTQFATLLLEEAGLDFLSAVQGHATTNTLPSWVPDWRVKGRRTVLAHLPLTEFNAGGQWETQTFRMLPATPERPKARIEVTATCLGEIRLLGEACDISSDKWQDVVFGNWKNLVLATRKTSHPRECPSKILSAFVETIMTDSDGEHAEVRTLLCRRLTASDADSRLSHQRLLEGIDREAVEKLRISCQGRRLFITFDGLVGLAASESQTRDSIAVFPGARLPYSFRQRDSHKCSDVELVDECFVQGMMRGEALGRGTALLKKDIRIC